MAEIKVNKGQWDAITNDDRQRILLGLRDTGAIKAGDVIVGDPGTPAMTEDTPLAPMWNPIKDLCKAACDVAAGTALAWCGANTAGLALAVCIAAAEAARNECKNRC